MGCSTHQPSEKRNYMNIGSLAKKKYHFYVDV